MRLSAGNNCPAFFSFSAPLLAAKVTAPSPTQALVFSGYLMCPNSTLIRHSYAECSPPLTATTLTLTLTDPFGNVTGSDAESAAAVLDAPTACAFDGSALLCTWRTNLLVSGVQLHLISSHLIRTKRSQTCVLCVSGASVYGCEFATHRHIRLRSQHCAAAVVCAVRCSSFVPDVHSPILSSIL